MISMFNPPHPAEILREDVFPELGLMVTEAANQIGVSRITLSMVLNGHATISPDMALRLEAWLGIENGGRKYNFCTREGSLKIRESAGKVDPVFI